MSLMDFVRAMSCGHGRSRHSVQLLTEVEAIVQLHKRYETVREDS